MGEFCAINPIQQPGVIHATHPPQSFCRHCVQSTRTQKRSNHTCTQQLLATPTCSGHHLRPNHYYHLSLSFEQQSIQVMQDVYTRD